jgi:hypothetical protein
LPSEWQTASARNHHEGINRAREAAEDLFKPQQQTTRAEVPISAPAATSAAEQQPRRQPRIFTISPSAPTIVAKVAPPAEPKPIPPRAPIRRETREIPASQFGRVRALTNYGMRRAQVAELYGVTVDEVERVIRQPDHLRKS